MSLQHLLPPNATPLEKAVMLAVLKQYAKLPLNIKRSLWNPNTCPVELLPWLAGTVGLQEWNNNWTEHIKRAQIRDAIVVAKKRGTLGAIKRSLNNYGVTVAIKPWFEYEPKKEPYTFDVTVVIDEQTASGVNNVELLESVQRDIERNKSLRDHYTLTQGVQLRGGLRLLGVMRNLSTTRLKLHTDVAPYQMNTHLWMIGTSRTLTSTRLPMTI